MRTIPQALPVQHWINLQKMGSTHQKKRKHQFRIILCRVNIIIKAQSNYEQQSSININVRHSIDRTVIKNKTGMWTINARLDFSFQFLRLNEIHELINILQICSMILMQIKFHEKRILGKMKTFHRRLKKDVLLLITSQWVAQRLCIFKKMTMFQKQKVFVAIRQQVAKTICFPPVSYFSMTFYDKINLVIFD